MAIPGDAVYRGKITVQNSKVSGSSDHSNFPVLLTEDNFWSELMDAGSESATNGGGGLRFSSDEAGTTQIAHEVMSFVTSATESSRAAQVWVKAPTLSYNTDTDIHVWSSPTASAEAATSAYGRNAVWSKFTITAHHSETSGTTAVDSAGYRDGTYSAGLPDPGADFGQSFDSDWIDYGASDIDITPGFRLNTRYKGDIVSAGVKQAIVYADGKFQFKIQNAKLTFTQISGGVVEFSGSTTLVAGTEYLLAVTYNTADGYALYINGVLDGSNSATSLASISGSDFSYASRHEDVSSLPMTGQGGIFQLSLDADTRGADWIATEYNNQSDPSTFAIAGTFQAGGGGTAHSLTLSESISSSSANSILWSIAANAPESIAAISAQSASAAFAVSASESAAASSAQSSSGATAVTVSESSALTSGQSAGLQIVASASESAAISDTESVAIVSGLVAVTVSESIAATSTQAVSQAAAVSVTESANTSSDQTASAAFSTAVAEAVSSADLQSISFALESSISEALATGSAQASLISIDGVVSEAIGTTSTQSAAVAFSPSVAFSTAVAEAVITAAAYQTSYADSIQAVSAESIGIAGEAASFTITVQRKTTLATHVATATLN